MDLTQYVLLAAVIVGATQFISHLRAKDYWGAATIIVAAIIGGIAGATHFENLPDVWTGVAAGFGAVGAVTVASKIGGISTITPKTTITK